MPPDELHDEDIRDGQHESFHTRLTPDSIETSIASNNEGVQQQEGLWKPSYNTHSSTDSACSTASNSVEHYGSMARRASDLM